ncbi:frizzled-4-like [Orbicella faveolata]|uniref:frizzled-4-like n=1 Tax=Orbicella faveolata TaxID=48498 RepID=UPI0009E1AA7C|nr:frizzled-4-like [Orbicella faveolata]
MRHHESKMNAFVVYLLLCVAPFYSDGNPVSSNQHQCEEIQIGLCKSLPYNRTRLPNNFEHDTQSSVNRTLWDLAQRINEVVCSEDLLFFVCSLYLPICVEDQEIKKTINPCRSVCEKVRSDCKAAVESITGEKFPFKAFPEFECEKLEVYDKGICLTPRAFMHPTSEFYLHASLSNNYLTTILAIKGRIASMNQTSSGYAIWFNVSRVIFKNGCSFRSHGAQIWSQGQCTSDNASTYTCFEVGKEYVILGHKHPSKGLKVGWALTLPQDKHLMDKLKTWKADLTRKNSKE